MYAWKQFLYKQMLIVAGVLDILQRNCMICITFTHKISRLLDIDIVTLSLKSNETVNQMIKGFNVLMKFLPSG